MVLPFSLIGTRQNKHAQRATATIIGDVPEVAVRTIQFNIYIIITKDGKEWRGQVHMWMLEWHTIRCYLYHITGTEYFTCLSW